MNFKSILIKRNILISLLTASSLILVLSFYFYEKNRITYYERNAEIVKLLEDYSMIGFETINNSIKNHSITTIKIEDKLATFDTINIEEVFRSTRKDYFLLLRITSMNCSSCVDSISQILARLKFHRYENFLVLSNYSNKEDVLNFLRASKLKSICVLDSSFLDCDKYGLPYFILVDREKRIVNSFFPLKGKPRLLFSYLYNLESILNSE